MAFDFRDVDIARVKKSLEQPAVCITGAGQAANWFVRVPTTMKQLPSQEGNYATPPSTSLTTSLLYKPLSTLGKLTTYTQAIVCIVGAALGTLLTTSSVGFVAALLLTRWLAPGTVHYSQPLYFDYSKPVVQGHALFGVPGSAPLLTPGQHADVWLTLQLPVEDPFMSTFQVSAALQSDVKTSPTARMSRAFRYQPPPKSMMQKLPWPLGPSHASSLEFTIPLFDDYLELPDTTLHVVQVAMLGRSGSDRVPEVLDAHVHVQLRLGVIRGLLYKVRPGLFTTVMLLLGAACTAGAGAALALGAGLLLLVTVRGGSSSPTTAATTTAPTTAVASSMEVAAGDEDGDFSSMMASESDVAEVLQDVGDGQDDGGDGQALLIQDGRATQGDVKDDSVCDNNTMQGNDGERSIIQLQQGESTAPPSPDILMETHVPHDHPAAQHLRRRVNAVNVS